MTILDALRQGVAALGRHKRIWFVFYAVATAAALLITAPIMSIAFQSLGSSAWAGQMSDNLDLSWLAELSAQFGAMPFTPIVPVIAGVGAISLVIYLFLLGGALEVLCAGGAFFAGCGRNFWRIVKLALISILFYAAALIVAGRVNALGRKIWGEGSEETPLVYWNWFHALVLLVLLGFVNLVFDYARVRMVADNQHKAWRAALGSFRLVWPNLFRTGALYLLVCAIAGVFFALYLAISHTVAQTSLGLVLLLFLVRQAMVIGKIWTRLLFVSTSNAMYRALQPPAPVPAIVPEPIVEPPQALIEVELSPELETNAFQFVTAWNQTPECRAVAEARLPGLAGVEGVVFDPTRLTGGLAVLSRLAEGADRAIDDLIRKALASRGIERSVTVADEPGKSGPRKMVAVVAIA